MSFISLGIFGLIAAAIQHWRILQHLKLESFQYTGYRPLVMIAAIILLLIGLFAFLAIVLQTTRPNYGGRRYWFTCPLTVNGWPCRRRVGKLYLPPGGKYFGCRHCYNLTYKSCQESDKRINLYWKNPAAMKAAMKGDHLSTESFLAMRAYLRIMNRLKEENERRPAKKRGQPPKDSYR